MERDVNIRKRAMERNEENGRDVERWELRGCKED